MASIVPERVKPKVQSPYILYTNVLYIIKILVNRGERSTGSWKKTKVKVTSRVGVLHNYQGCPYLVEVDEFRVTW